MFYFQFSILTVCFLICHAYSQSTNSSKCGFTDSECLKAFFQGLAREKGPTGLLEIGIPPVDPYKLFNIVVSALDLLKMTLVEGECIGIAQTCTVLKYETDLKHMNRNIEIMCDRIVIQGIYSIRSHPVLCYILGNVHGDGNGTILLEDWYFKFKYNFELIEHKNGQIHVKPDFETAEWMSEVQKKATIIAENIMLDHRDVTDRVVKFINKNWTLIFGTLAYWFHKISVEYYFKIWEIIFENISTSTYTNDDLTPFTEAEDGEIYFEPIYSEAEWDSEVLKNVTVSADNILLDDKDVSECVLTFIDGYWSAVFGTPAYWFHKKSMDTFFDVWQQIYSFVPTSPYICDDLTPYL